MEKQKAGNRRTVSVMLTSSERERLETFAERRGLSLSSAARMLVLEGIGQKSRART